MTSSCLPLAAVRQMTGGHVAGASLVAAQLSAIADAVLRTSEACVDLVINLSEVHCCLVLTLAAAVSLVYAC